MSVTPQTKPLCVSVDEFCRLASIKRTTAYLLLRSGQVESLRLGRRRLVTLRSIEALLGIAPAQVANGEEQ